MKKQVLMIAAVAFTVTVNAQSLQEGIKMYHYERYESAKKQLSPLAATDPVANYYLGLAELKSGNVDNAATIFAKYPENYANIAGTAMVNFAKGKTAEGTQIAQGLASKAKKKEWEQLKYAADAITNSPNSNKQLAIDWYKEVLARNGNNATPELLISMGDAYQELPAGGGPAQTSYEKASEKDAKNSLAFSRQGKLWYDARNYDLALSTWKKANDADPENPLPYRDLAQAYAASGKYDLALQNVEKYYERSDKTLADKAQFADILFLSKNYDRAAQMAQEIINAGVTTPRVYGLLGFAQAKIKDTANALKNARVYIEKSDVKKIFPSDYIAFAEIFLQNSLPDSAEVYFNKAVAMDSSASKTATYRSVAETFRLGKNWKKAAAWYAKTAEQPDAQPIDYFWAGTMYYYDNNYADAGVWFERAETKFPDQVFPPYWRGRVAAAIDNEAKTGAAAPFYTKWLEKVGPGYDKKADLMQAYQYLYLYAYNTNNKEAMKKYRELILAIEPNNGLIKQIDEAMKKKS